MAVFSLKARDTRPILEVALLNPDGTAHNLTGTTVWKMHIRVSPSVVVTRDLVKQGLDTAGVLRYTWAAADWNAGALPIPTSPYRKYVLEMEYEIQGGSGRMTFPSASFDKLEIRGDLAQA